VSGTTTRSRNVRRFGPIETRQADPGLGYSLEEARDMIAQGYSSEHVSRVTGFSESMLLAPPPRRKR
jgi:hypothetical protein